MIPCRVTKVIRGVDMPAAMALREDYSSIELRRLATLAETKEATQRLLALAAGRDGMSREAAALIGGMDR